MKVRDEEEDNVIDQLSKVIENNLKLEISINKNLEEAENFIKNKEWKILEDFTYHFKQNIDYIWDMVSNSKYQIFKLKKGSNIWNLGNIFEGKIFDAYEYNAKVIKQKIYSELKKIEWIIFFGNGENFRLKFSLYKVTRDNSTVLQMKAKYTPSNGQNIVLKIKDKFNKDNFIKVFENFLNKEEEYSYQYESGIIPNNMEGIWEILTDSSKLVSVAPNNKCFVPFNINNIKVGQTANVPMKIKNKEGFLEIKMDLNEKKCGWNKWAFGYSILKGKPFKIVKQTVLVQLTKINKSETQLSIFTKIYESISTKMLQYLSKEKRYAISSIKNYFENDSIKDDDVNN